MVESKPTISCLVITITWFWSSHPLSGLAVSDIYRLCCCRSKFIYSFLSQINSPWIQDKWLLYTLWNSFCVRLYKIHCIIIYFYSKNSRKSWSRAVGLCRRKQLATDVMHTFTHTFASSSVFWIQYKIDNIHRTTNGLLGSFHAKKCCIHSTNVQRVNPGYLGPHCVWLKLALSYRFWLEPGVEKRLATESLESRVYLCC